MSKQKIKAGPPKEVLLISSLSTSSPTQTEISLQEYKDLSSFVQRTTETMHKMKICMKQLDRDIENLQYELKVALNEYANFHHTLEDFEIQTKREERNLLKLAHRNLT